MGSGPITSRTSARVLAVRRLHSAKGRREAGLILVEGADGVQEALASRFDVLEVFVAPRAAERDREILALARASGADVVEVSESVMDAMAQTQAPQGLVATCAWAPSPLRAAIQAGGSTIVLEAVSDPGNAGTIMRTADAVGLAGVVLTEGSVDPANGKCVRASAGSAFRIPVAAGVPMEAVLAAARQAGLVVVAATADGEQDLFDWTRSRERAPDCCWVLGSEAHGLSDLARSAADVRVRIPMSSRHAAGGPESLNVASAAAVCLYAAFAVGMED